MNSGYTKTDTDTIFWFEQSQSTDNVIEVIKFAVFWGTNAHHAFAHFIELIQAIIGEDEVDI